MLAGKFFDDTRIRVEYFSTLDFITRKIQSTSSSLILKQGIILTKNKDVNRIGGEAHKYD